MVVSAPGRNTSCIHFTAAIAHSSSVLYERAMKYELPACAHVPTLATGKIPSSGWASLASLHDASDAPKIKVACVPLDPSATCPIGMGRCPCKSAPGPRVVEQSPLIFQYGSIAFLQLLSVKKATEPPCHAHTPDAFFGGEGVIPGQPVAATAQKSPQGRTPACDRAP